MKNEDGKSTDLETYLYFQGAHRVDDGEDQPSKAMILPANFKKSKLPDYRPGPVRTYTKDEIAEYEMTSRGFCPKCGASVPHRYGEGRCQYCMVFLPPEESRDE